MNEQILKRLQDTMKLYSVVLEQLEELQWLVKDIIEDLEEELNPILGPAAVDPVKAGAPKTEEVHT